MAGVAELQEASEGGQHASVVRAPARDRRGGIQFAQHALVDAEELQVAAHALRELGENATNLLALLGR